MDTKINEIMEDYTNKKMIADLAKNEDPWWLHMSGISPLCGITSTDKVETDGSTPTV